MLYMPSLRGRLFFYARFFEDAAEVEVSLAASFSSRASSSSAWRAARSGSCSAAALEPGPVFFAHPGGAFCGERGLGAGIC